MRFSRAHSTVFQVAGILTVVLGVGVAAAFPLPPQEASASSAEIVRFYTHHREAALWQIYLGSLTLVPFLIFTCGLHRAVSCRATRLRLLVPLLLVCAVLWLGILFVALIGIAALAFEVAGLRDPTIARAVFVLAEMAFSFALVPSAGMTAAASLLSVEVLGLPRWLGWSGCLLAALYIVALGLALVVNQHDLVHASFAAFYAWILATSVIWLRSSSAPEL